MFIFLLRLKNILRFLEINIEIIILNILLNHDLPLNHMHSHFVSFISLAVNEVATNICIIVANYQITINLKIILAINL